MRQESINLTKEIIIHIMGNLGFVPNSKFGNFGASTDNFIIDKKINLSNDLDQNYSCNIWAATAKLNNSTFRILFSDLTSEDKIPDFAMTLRVNDGPIHAMSISFYQDDTPNYFLFFDEKSYKNISNLIDEEEKNKIPDMIEASTYDKCMSLAGIELLTQTGVDWIELDDYDDLYKALIKLVEK